ncbi:DUF6114 domain-containing protein [Janibacter sp. GS2]|uniref:DUF6114 domain-containing protein n=1 Tax=Janibacter sp. GS2 TaxID=3442646 RepID=UPI003EBAD30C
MSELARHPEPSTTSRGPRPGTRRARLRAFRRTRPFWGCLILTLAAYFIISPVLTSVSATVSMGTAAVSGWVVGAIMLAAAGVSLVAPGQRHFAAIVAMIVSVASLVLTNLGGYIIGMALGIVGSGMIFAWTPTVNRRGGAHLEPRGSQSDEDEAAERAADEPALEERA